MSELDLTEALAAADKAWREAYFNGAASRILRDTVVIAAAPLIEAQVREMVAREISDDLVLYAEIERLAAGRNHSTAADKIQDAVTARIARGRA